MYGDRKPGEKRTHDFTIEESMPTTMNAYLKNISKNQILEILMSRRAGSATDDLGRLVADRNHRILAI